MKNNNTLNLAAVITFLIALFVLEWTPALSTFDVGPVTPVLLGPRLSPSQTAGQEEYSLRIGYFLVPKNEPYVGYTYGGVPITVGGGMWLHFEYTRELATNIKHINVYFHYQTTAVKIVCDLGQSVHSVTFCNTMPYRY